MKHAILLASIGLTLAGCAKQQLTLLDGHEDAGPAGETLHQKLAWMVGDWTGTLGGTPIEETWLPSYGNDMTGVMRWLDEDGAVRMHEVMSIRDTAEGRKFFLRHFNANLTTWESERERPIEFAITMGNRARLVLDAPADAGIRRLTT